MIYPQSPNGMNSLLYWLYVKMYEKNFKIIGSVKDPSGAVHIAYEDKSHSYTIRDYITLAPTGVLSMVSDDPTCKELHDVLSKGTV